ncbi:hypothetical protein COY95_02140, partial [Candidatus Woesearchaeota archaeon CG_4_10_14_0_8_um_filter_47_5]
SASLGNVVYPRDWLAVAPPELLRLFYNKRLMKTRSFSWKDLPKMYDEYDSLTNVYLGKEHPPNPKEEAHLKRLFEISALSHRVPEPVGVSFSHAVMLPQIFFSEKDIIASLKKSGHYDEKRKREIFARIEAARVWLGKYAPEEAKFTVQDVVPSELVLSGKEQEALHRVSAFVRKNPQVSEVDLHTAFYTICKEEVGLEPREFFTAAYRVLLNRDRGPRLARLVLTLGERALSLLEAV